VSLEPLARFGLPDFPDTGKGAVAYSKLSENSKNNMQIVGDETPDFKSFNQNILRPSHFHETPYPPEGLKMRAGRNGGVAWLCLQGGEEAFLAQGEPDLLQQTIR
jgi:hypothetical protein